MVDQVFASAQAFAALMRFYTVLSPDFAEGRWQHAREFEALPRAQRSPDHWYRFESGRGFIRVDKDLNGQWYRELPAEVDPSCVISVPATTPTTSFIDMMSSVVSKFKESGADTTKLDGLLKNLVKLRDAEHESALVRKFAEAGFIAVAGGPDCFLAYLSKRREFLSDNGISDGLATGRDVAAILVIEDLARSVAKATSGGVTPKPAAIARMFGLLLAPGATSMEFLAQRFVRDSCVHGFQQQVLETLETMRRNGGDAIESARQGWTLMGRPELQLDIYYQGIFIAAPYLRAAQIGYQVVSGAPSLNPQERIRLAKFANAAEEKLARVTDALMFAILDLDGSRFRAIVDEIESLRRAGREEEAQALAVERIDLKLSYPRPFLSVLLNGPR